MLKVQLKLCVHNLKVSELKKHSDKKRQIQNELKIRF